MEGRQDSGFATHSHAFLLVMCLDGLPTASLLRGRGLIGVRTAPAPPSQAPFASSNTVLSWTFLHLLSWRSLMTHQLSSQIYSSTFESWGNQGVGCPPMEWGPQPLQELLCSVILFKDEQMSVGLQP